MDIINAGMTGDEFITAINAASNTLDVTDFGAIGDGLTDNTDILITAFSEAMTLGRPLFFPAGDYLITRSDTIYVTNNLHLIGSHSSRITANQCRITFACTPSASTTLTTSITKHDYILDTDSLFNSVSIGDVLEIKSTDGWGWQPAYIKGEEVRVKNIVGENIHLTESTYDLYDKATTTIRNINAKSVKIEGLGFNGVLMSFDYCQDILIADCKIVNGRSYPLVFNYCYNTLVQNNEIHNDVDAGHSYGISTASTYNSVIKDNKVSFYTQAIVAGGAYPCRRYVVDSNYVTSNYETAGQIDTHANVEIAMISNNVCRGAGQLIYCKGIDVSILNNKCYMTSANSIGIVRQEEQHWNVATGVKQKNHYANIKGNTIVADDVYTNTIGIHYNFETTDEVLDFIDISDNYVYCDIYALLFSNNGDGTTNTVKKVTIANNYFETWGSGGGTVWFNLQVVFDTIRFFNNDIIGALYTVCCNSLDCTNFILEFNRFKTSYTMSFLIAGVSYLVVKNNFIEVGGFTVNGTLLVLIKGNIFKDITPSNFTLVDYTAADKVIMDHNIYVNGTKRESIVTSDKTILEY